MHLLPPTAGLETVAAVLGWPMVLGLWVRAARAARPKPWLGLGHGVFMACLLLSPAAVFLLPILGWLLAACPDRGLRVVGFASGLLAALVGCLLPLVLRPDHGLAGLAETLWPLLGSRWDGNVLWLGVAGLVILGWRGRVGIAPQEGSAAPPLVAGVLYALLAAVAHGRGMPGLGQFLLWGSLWLEAVGLAGMSMRQRSRSRLMTTVAGVGAALLLVAFSWPLLSSAPTRPGFPVSPWSEGLLLVALPGAPPPGEVLSAPDPRQPSHLLFLNRVDDLPAFMERGRLALFHAGVRVVGPAATARPWLKPVAPESGQIAAANLGLWVFYPAGLPRPLTMYPAPDDSPPLEDLFADGVWTHESFTRAFTLVGTGPRRLDLRLRGWRPPAAVPLVPGLQLVVNGTRIPLTFHQQTFFRWELPAGTLEAGGNTLTLSCPPFVPAQVMPGSSDSRRLGLDLESLVLY